MTEVENLNAVSMRSNYSAPQLVQFGSVSDLTATGSKAGEENQGNVTGGLGKV